MQCVVQSKETCKTKKIMDNSLYIYTDLIGKLENHILRWKMWKSGKVLVPKHEGPRRVHDASRRLDCIWAHVFLQLLVQKLLSDLTSEAGASQGL